MTDPRGIRNNNPLNIDHHARNQWQGLDDPPTDGRFARFVKPEWGLRAAICILRRYETRGMTTIAELLETWAPSAENDVSAYLASVMKTTGWKADYEPNLQDKADTLELLKAMEKVECGPAKGTANGLWLDDAVYEAAWSLSKPLAKSRSVRGSSAAIGAAAAGAVIEAATTVLPQAADAAAIVTPIWPEIARWVLIAVVIAGAGLALYSRLQARKEGIR